MVIFHSFFVCFPSTVLEAEALMIGLLVAEVVQPGRGLHAAAVLQNTTGILLRGSFEGFQLVKSHIHNPVPSNGINGIIHL